MIMVKSAPRIEILGGVLSKKGLDSVIPGIPIVNTNERTHPSWPIFAFLEVCWWCSSMVPFGYAQCAFYDAGLSIKKKYGVHEVVLLYLIEWNSSTTG